MRSIRIIATPPGEAPEHIREAWIGTEIPLFSQRDDGRINSVGDGVLTGPRTHFGAFWAWAWARGKTAKESGYVVSGRAAIAELEVHRPDAAAWWRENVPRASKMGWLLHFSTEVCEVVDAG